MDSHRFREFKEMHLTKVEFDKYVGRCHANVSLSNLQRGVQQVGAGHQSFVQNSAGFGRCV